jgi:hypothetical protein
MGAASELARCLPPQKDRRHDGSESFEPNTNPRPRVRLGGKQRDRAAEHQKAGKERDCRLNRIAKRARNEQADHRDQQDDDRDDSSDGDDCRSRLLIMATRFQGAIPYHWPRLRLLGLVQARCGNGASPL